MTLKPRIQNDLKEAMKNAQEVEASTLRMLLAAFVNKEKEKGEVLSDEQAQDIIAAEAKKRRESMEAFAKGGRSDLVAKEQKELEILLQYLPEQMSEQEIRALVKEAIEQTGAATFQDRGKVMAVVMPQVKAKADGALVSAIVKELLG